MRSQQQTILSIYFPFGILASGSGNVGVPVSVIFPPNHLTTRSMKQHATLPLLLLVTVTFSACSSFLGRQPDNQHPYSLTLLNRDTDQPIPDVDISFQAYFTGTFGRAYLLDDRQTTNASGEVEFVLEYDDDLAQQYKDSVESETEEPVFQIGINALFAVWEITDQNGQMLPPVIINRELPPGTNLTYRVSPTAAMEFIMLDTLNPQLADEVRINWREVGPTPQTPFEGSLIYDDVTMSGPVIRAIPADAEVEINWETFEGPDLGSLQKSGEGADTVNVSFGQTGSLTIYH